MPLKVDKWNVTLAKKKTAEDHPKTLKRQILLSTDLTNFSIETSADLQMSYENRIYLTNTKHLHYQTKIAKIQNNA